MTNVASHESPLAASRPSTTRSAQLADRLETGARALATLAGSLSDREWQLPLAGDGRKVGVVVHHVANMYPLEMNLSLTIARGEAITGVSWNDVHAINAAHAAEHAAVTRDAAIDLLLRNSRTAADQIRALTDEELDRAVPVSLYEDAPLTCQFFLEDHPVRHSYHHLAKIRATVVSGV
jgi:hypothetical protein